MGESGYNSFKKKISFSLLLIYQTKQFLSHGLYLCNLGTILLSTINNKQTLTYLFDCEELLGLSHRCELLITILIRIFDYITHGEFRNSHELLYQQLESQLWGMFSHGILFLEPVYNLIIEMHTCHNLT